MSRGRPRTFDVDEALESALCVFWTKGYEGASLQDLTEAMGINRPSLYAAFGNKEELFCKALDRYISKNEENFRAALNGPDLRAAIERVMHHAVEMGTSGQDSRGCMLVSSLTCGEDAEPIKKELAARRAQSETWLRDRFKRAKASGELPADTDAPALARFYSAVLQGISVQAASGASRKALKGIVTQAMRAWPV